LTEARVADVELVAGVAHTTHTGDRLEDGADAVLGHVGAGKVIDTIGS
jgi:hypothetical protein